MTYANLTRAGYGIIKGCRQILKEDRAGKINDYIVDRYTAAAIVAVYDGAKRPHKRAFRSLPIASMANVAFRVIG